MIAILVTLVVGWYDAEQHARAHGQRMQAWATAVGRWVPGRSNVVRVVVHNPETQAPIRGVRVTARVTSTGTGAHIAAAESVQTGRDGVAQLTLQLPSSVPAGGSDLHIDVEREADQVQFKESVLLEDALDLELRTTLATDKPRYQPGDTIHFRLLALADQGPVAGSAVSFEVFDPNGTRVYAKEARTSPFGIAAAECPLAAMTNLGRHKIKATIRGATVEREVDVARSTPPRFRVTVRPDETSQHALARVEARYLFGQPVRGAEVKVTIESLGSASQTTRGGKTDAHGIFQFDVPADGGMVHAEVATRGMGRQEAQHLLESPHERRDRPLLVSVVPENRALVRGLKNRVYVLTTLADGTPTPANVVVDDSAEIMRTSMLGIGTFTIVPRGDDFWRKPLIKATSAQGGIGYGTPILAVDPNDDAFLLRTDRSVYPAGATVTVSLASSRDGRFYVDITRMGVVVASQFMDVQRGSGTGVVTLPDSLTGFFEIRATRFSKLDIRSRSRQPRYSYRAKNIYVGMASSLDVRLELAKPSFAPGATAPLRVQVQRGGQPIAAAVTLTAVDEAILRATDEDPGDLVMRLSFDAKRFAAEAPGYPMALVNTIGILEPSAAQRDAQAALLAGASTLAWTARLSPTGQFTRTRWRGATPQERATKFSARHTAWRRRAGAVIALVLSPLLLLLVAAAVAYARLRARDGLPRYLFSAGGALAPIARAQGVGAVLSAVAAGTAVAHAHNASLGWLAVWAIPGLSGLGLLAWSGLRLGRITAVSAYPSLRSFAWLVLAAHVGLQSLAFVVPPMQLPVNAERGCMLAVVGLIGVLTGSSALVFRGSAWRSRGWRGLWRFASRAALASTLCAAASLGMVQSRDAFAVAEAPPRAEDGRAFADFGWFVLPPPRPDEEVEKSGNEGVNSHAVANLQLAPPGAARLRKSFPESLLWLPELITDNDGFARVDIPVADSITTWRLSAAAVSGAGQVGSANRSLLAFQDFFAAMDLPHDLTVGDEVLVPVSVFNYLPTPQTIEVRFESSTGLDPVGDAVREVAADPGGSAFASFRVRATGAGEQRATVRVKGTTAGDAVERMVKVHPDGREIVETRNGLLSDKASVSVVLPDEAIPGVSDLHVKLYPSELSQVAEGLQGVFQKPHGCFEQTLATTYPSVLALRYLRAAKVNAPSIEQKARATVGPGYQRLLTFELRDGGFSLFGHAPATVVLTAYGLWQFVDMAAVYPVDANLIDRTRAWLLRLQRADGTWGDSAESARVTAYVAWVLAETGYKGDEVGRALDRVASGDVQKSDDAYLVALAANALLAGGRSEAAAPLLDRLEAMRNEGQPHWSGEWRSLHYSWGDGLREETTALAALALHRAKRNPTLVERSVAWLIHARDQNGTWASTSATVAALRLLLARAHVEQAEGPRDISIRVRGEVAGRVRTEPSAWELPRLVDVSERFRPGANEVALEATGRGALGFQVVARHFEPWARFRAPQNPFTLRVRYAPTVASPGDVITCNVHVDWSRGRPATMFMLEVGVPPGMSVVEEDLEALVRSRAIRRYETGPRHVVLYLRDLLGWQDLSFRLATSNAGRVKAPPSIAYPYYEPELRAFAAPAWIDVR